MAKTGLAPRRAALWLIGQVQSGRLMSELLPQGLDHLEAEERARAARLALTTFRWIDRADRMLGPYLREKPDDRVLNALRLGVVELAVDRSAAHGVLDALVEIMRRERSTRRASGLVNAVLRRVVKDLEKWETLPIPLLPKPLRKQMLRIYGKAIVQGIEQAHVKDVPLDVTPREDLLGLTARLGGTALPTGSIRLSAPGQVSALPEYEAGTWWVQDMAAALPARILNVQPGERVLDLCAAPGGKTMQLAAMGADVTAVDISQGRLDRVRENLDRTKLSANLIHADALEFSGGPFDAVLLDAPCSATGTIRRHPDLPLAKAKADFSEQIELQAKMLDKACALLKPGGRLVYCTCSLLPDEGETQVQSSLMRLPLTLDANATSITGVEPSWIGECGLRTRPDYLPELGGMDGFFIAALCKEP